MVLTSQFCGSWFQKLGFRRRNKCALNRFINPLYEEHPDEVLINHIIIYGLIVLAILVLSCVFVYDVHVNCMHAMSSGSCPPYFCTAWQAVPVSCCLIIRFEAITRVSRPRNWGRTRVSIHHSVWHTNLCCSCIIPVQLCRAGQLRAWPPTKPTSWLGHCVPCQTTSTPTQHQAASPKGFFIPWALLKGRQHHAKIWWPY